MNSGWMIDCPVCDEQMYGYEETYNEEVTCRNCGSILEISCEEAWDTCVEVVERKADYDSVDEDTPKEAPK